MNENKTKSKKIKVAIVTVFFIIAIPILIMSAIIMIKANLYPDKVPDVFGYKPMIVLSGSMETSIYTGDLVFVKIVDDVNTLEENDVIAFRNEEDTVTVHRIIEIIEENGEIYFKTKGDNNNVEDANLVEVEAIEGIYVFKISGLGNVLMYIKEPSSLLTILLAIFVIGLIWLYATDKMQNKRKNKEDEQYRKEFEEFKRQQKNETKK